MTIITQVEKKVKSWQEMSQREKWFLDPYRAGREDALKMRFRYGLMGGQTNYVLLINANLYLEIAEGLVDEHPGRARYYLDLANERIQILEEKIRWQRV